MNLSSFYGATSFSLTTRACRLLPLLSAPVGREPFAKHTTLLLRQTKTGPNQFVTVVDRSVDSLLRSLLVGLRRDDHVFGFTQAALGRSIRAVCGLHGLSQRYVPHSLRHGGATALHLAGTH